MTHTVADDNVNYGAKAWVVVFSAALFFFYEFIQMNMFNAFDPYFMKAFHIGAEKLGELSAYYFYGDVLFLFFAGMILDRFSTRWLLSTAMAISVISTFMFSISDAFWQASIFRFLTGAAAAFCLLSAVRLASRWFSPKRMAMIIGLVVTMAMLGGTIAQTPFTLLADSIGWRATLMSDAGLGVLLLIIIISCVRDYPKDYQEDFELASENTAAGKLSVSETIKRVVKKAQNWLAGIYTSLMNLPIMILGVVYGVMYLVHVHHLSREHASEITSMIYVGTIFGSPIIGWFSDRIKRRKAPMIVAALLSVLLVLMIMYVPGLTFSELMVSFFVLGFLTSAQIITYPLVIESNPLAITGAAEGLSSTLIMAGGFVQPLFGYLIQLHWSHKMAHHLPVYSTSDYNLAMWIMPVAFGLSLILALFLKETHCKNYQS